nr:SIR2 family protein [Algimonas ampicilliniresistens]
MTRLVHTRQPGQPAPWVFTTNYDMAIELAAENASLNVRDGFRGFHNRVFSPSSFDLGLRNTESRGEAQFGTYEIYLAKLHGSLSWEQTASGDVRAFQIDARCGDIFDFVDGNTATSPSSLIFPSSAKFVDTVGFVYGEMIRRFTHFLSRPNVTLLISGYGFGDFHLNRVLLSALNNPTLQLVVYLPEINGFEANGDPTNLADLRPGLVKFLNLKLPQVAILGGGAAAYFSEMTSHLPDPTILDDPAERSRQIAKALAQELNPTTPTTPPTPTTTTPIL